ncbi:GerAB/ArcD/ProY family transporter [Paenibacillus spongiae]|uniref:GerAB/ArcD/ProY family transporter n=1 Tax=Paenibacillus spongiae TaxID=2909671 RepID=A0ABY5SG67_9BACL|nr:GerAB/ArcD/ProY family transporter [Paenibacillus spongiae]UVI32992.1 GerAB/ArcD/ProY family transporter [Paenibacillus spongiae]
MEVSFSRLQLIFLLLLSLGISNHVLIIPHLIQAAGRDAWISIIVAYLVLIGWSVILYVILRSMRTSPLDSWLIERIGKFGSRIVTGGLAFYLLIAGTLIIFDTVKNINIYFLPHTPNLVITLTFILLSYNAARSGLKTLIYLSAALLPLVWILGFGVSSMTMSSKDYGMLYPVFTEGILPDIRGGAIVFGGSMDLLIILLLQYKLKKPLNYGTLFVLLTILIGLIMGPTIGATAAFGPFQAGNMRFPAFEQWRLVMLGRQISHVDFLAVFQLMSGSVLRTALIIHLVSETLGGRSIKPIFRQSLMLSVTAIMSLPTLMELSDILVQKLIHNYFYTYSLWFGIIITGILLAAVCLPKKKKGGKANESVT